MERDEFIKGLTEKVAKLLPYKIDVEIKPTDKDDEVEVILTRHFKIIKIEMELKNDGGVEKMIFVIIIALVGIIYIYSQYSMQKDILFQMQKDILFQMQEMRCKHCIFNPGISVLNGGRISICRYRQSPTRCDRDSIIAMNSCSMEDRQKLVERTNLKYLRR